MITSMSILPPKSLILPPAVKLQTKRISFLQNQVRTRETLADHLMWQIRMADPYPGPGGGR
jgi:hypothetical protein